MCEHLSVDIEKRTYLLRGSRRNQKTFKNAQKITKFAIIRNIVSFLHVQGSTFTYFIKCYYLSKNQA